ncbi:UNVERIFIED_CONTAM: hypothetical protein Sindi_0462700 [Sesamum indicum]
MGGGGDKSYLGFGQANPGDGNGESDANQSLAKFNVEEFLNLAYKVEAVAPVTRQQPWKMLVPMSMTGKRTGEIHIPPEKRIIVPEHAKAVVAAEYGDEQQVPAGCSQTVPTKGRIDGLGVDDDNRAEFHVDDCPDVAHVRGDVEADMASNGRDEVDCVGSKNAINADVQLEKQVHHVDKVHAMAYKQAPKGQPIVLQKWEPGMVMRKLKHTQVPIWIWLRDLPIKLWTEEGLSTVASGVGKLLYLDAITRACTRLDFARVCVMLDISSKLPKHIIMMSPDEDGGE